MKTVATDELDELSAALEDPLHAGLEAALQRVSDAAERHLALESPAAAAFMAQMVKQLRGVDGTDFAAQRINALLDAFTYFYYTATRFDVAAIASDALGLARRSGHALLRKALTFQGIIEADTGNSSRAIECYAEAVDVARAQRDIEGETSVWNNLGAALINAAQYRDALACYEHVIHLVNTCGAPAYFAKIAAANIALCCIYTGETERGLSGWGSTG